MRFLLILAAVCLASPLWGQDQEARNPFSIVLGPSTISALQANPSGLVWQFDTAAVGTHDGVVVSYDATDIRTSDWALNDRTIPNLYSLDVSDEELGRIKEWVGGLPALIQPADQARVRGVLLRYISASTPVPANEKPLVPTTPFSSSGSDSSQRTSGLLDPNFKLADDPGTSLRGSAGDSTAGAPLSSESPYYRNRNQNFSPQSSELTQPRRSAENNSIFSNAPRSNSGFSSDRVAANDPLLAPPTRSFNYNGQPQNGYVASESALPIQRRQVDYVPQTGFGDSAGGLNAGGASGLQVAANLPAGNNSQLAAVPIQWQAEMQTLIGKLGQAETQLTESKQRSVFLLFMLFLAVGLCIYLAWLARGFYFRYAELADELRETFTTTS